MTTDAARVEAEALEWTVRVLDPDFADWDALSAWLAADRRNADTFNWLMLLDDEIVGMLRIPPPGS